MIHKVKRITILDEFLKVIKKIKNTYKNLNDRKRKRKKSIKRHTMGFAGNSKMVKYFDWRYPLLRL